MVKGYLKYLVVSTLVIGTGAALMIVSHKAHFLQKKIARTQMAIEENLDAIRILEAEWAYLNNPERLEILATQYLDLEAPAHEQLVSDFSFLPEPAISEPDSPLMSVIQKPVMPRSLDMREAYTLALNTGGVE